MAVIWAVLLTLNDVNVQAALVKPFSGVVTGAVLALLIFDLFLWRIRWLQGWLVHRPDLRGTWKVELRSDWRDPAGGDPRGPIAAFLCVRQSYSKLSMRLLTAESSSELAGSEIVQAADGTFQIAAVYRNEPRLIVREKNPIHYGAILLVVRGTPPDSLSGHYWTDRKTRGEIVSLAQHRKLFDGFEEAARAFPSDTPRTDTSAKLAGGPPQSASDAKGRG